MQRWILLLGFACGLTSVSCDERKKDPSEEQCTSVCLNILCDTYTAEGAVHACADDCVDRHAETLGINEECADRYSSLLDCLEVLECDDGRIWSILTGSVSEDYACKDETLKFNASCPGVWFDPKK